jgi:hypothetical protein
MQSYTPDSFYISCVAGAQREEACLQKFGLRLEATLVEANEVGGQVVDSLPDNINIIRMV